jgi:dTDP-4-amino-4,6-dideoxygalactose transaminase
MYNQIIELLKEYTDHNIIELTSRGNTALFAAFYCARKINLERKVVLVPDQGGWLTYLRYPKMLELGVVQVKTNYGIIDLKDLKKKLKNANNKISNDNVNNKICCLVYQNPAGYFAAQPIKEIYNICKKNSCLVILDASGSVGDKELCNGNYADFIISSFGKWKPINLGYGGFVSIKDKAYYNKVKEIFNTTTFNACYYASLLNKLRNIKDRYKLFYKMNTEIKDDLKNFNIILKDKKGINVIVKFKNRKEKQEIIKYCEKNKYEFTLCPRYIRVNEKAVSIEVKRL